MFWVVFWLTSCTDFPPPPSLPPPLTSTPPQVVLSSIDDFARGARLGATAIATEGTKAVTMRKVGAGELLGEAAYFTEVWTLGSVVICVGC